MFVFFFVSFCFFCLFVFFLFFSSLLISASVQLRTCVVLCVTKRVKIELVQAYFLQWNLWMIEC